MNKSVTYGVSFLLLLLLGSCGESVNTVDGPAQSMFSLQLKNTFGSEDLTYFKPVADTTGRQLYFEVSRYYLSNVELLKENGEIHPFTGRVLLVKHEGATNFKLDTIPPGKYKGVKMNLGLDERTNASNPASFSDDDPLAMQDDVPMFWDGFNGYIFIRLEGKVDTSQAQLGVLDMPMRYEIGRNDTRRVIRIDRSFTVQPGIDVEYEIEVDHKELLKSLDLSTQHTQGEFGSQFVGQRIANNAVNAFR